MSDLENAIKSGLNTVINSTFGNLLKSATGEITTVVNKISEFTPQKFEDNINASFTDLFGRLEGITEDIVGKISMALDEPINAILSVGEFTIFILTIKKIFVENIFKVLGYKVKFELAKPFFENTIKIVQTLYDFKDVLIYAEYTRRLAQFQYYRQKYNFYSTKGEIKRTIRVFKVKEKLKANLFLFIVSMLISVLVSSFLKFYKNRVRI